VKLKKTLGRGGGHAVEGVVMVEVVKVGTSVLFMMFWTGESLPGGGGVVVQRRGVECRVE
jgi:hypothetical protein